MASCIPETLQDLLSTRGRPDLQAALMDVRIPHVEMTEGSAEDQPEIQLDDDPEVAATLDTTHVPLIITIAQVPFCRRLSARGDICVDLCVLMLHDFHTQHHEQGLEFRAWSQACALCTALAPLPTLPSSLAEVCGANP